jgi:hypothetical protein
MPRLAQRILDALDAPELERWTLVDAAWASRLRTVVTEVNGRRA